MTDYLPEWPTHCARCSANLRVVASTLSYFNQETICIDCKQDEVEAPGYPAAVAAETAAVSAGNYNFHGIGLSPDDQTFLAERRALRKA